MAFFLKFKLKCLSKMHGYPQFSFWIPRVLTKIYFIGVRAGGAAVPPVSEIFGQNAHNSGNKETIKDGIKKIYNCFKFFKWKLVSSTQQLILLTLFIIRPVSSDQTDSIRDSNKMSKGNYNCSFIYEVIVQKHVPVKL